MIHRVVALAKSYEMLWPITMMCRDFLPAAKHAGLWIIIGCPSQSSQESLYRPEKHGNIGN